MDDAEALLIETRFILIFIYESMSFKRYPVYLRIQTKKPKNETWEIITGCQFVLRDIFFVSVSHFVHFVRDELNVANLAFDL